MAVSMSTDRILVDIDVDYDTFMRRYSSVIEARARALLGSLVDAIWFIKSPGGHVHGVVKLNMPIDAKEALMYAVLMGSDIKRECINWQRLQEFGDSMSLFATGYIRRNKPNCIISIKQFTESRCMGLVNMLKGWSQWRLWLSH